jgi:hypothetical protein
MQLINGIESFQDFEKSNKDFVPSWNVKMWIHLVRNIKKKEEFNCVMMKNIKLFENFRFRKIMTIKKFNEELSFSLIKCDYKVRTVDNPLYDFC